MDSNVPGKAYKTNYHMHTTFCDGKATPEQMVEEAIKRNFDIIGFSGHSMYPFASDWHIAPREHLNYSAKIHELAQKYKDKIEIYCGYEADYIPGVCKPDLSFYKELGAEYLVGSVHYVVGKGGFIEADGDFAKVREGIKKYFNNDVKLAVTTYFSLEKEMLEKGNFTFLGHADLFRKQNSKSLLFDTRESWYKEELLSLTKKIASSGVCVELNTGAIARGYLDLPYPDPYFLSLLHEHNVPVTINSDAHTTQHIDFWFEEAKEYIKKAGYKELMFFQSGKLKSFTI